MGFSLKVILGMMSFGSLSYGAPCQPIAVGEAEFTIERTAATGSELSFWLWPNRKALRLEGGPFGQVAIEMKDSRGNFLGDTQNFYLFFASDKEYKACVEKAIEASTSNRTFTARFQSAQAGYFEMDKSKCDQQSWGAFQAKDVVCELH